MKVGKWLLVISLLGGSFVAGKIHRELETKAKVRKIEKLTFYKERSEAISGITQILRSEPIYEGYYYRGTLYYKENQFDKAILDFNEALKLAKNVEDKYIIYYMRASSHYCKRNYDKAISDYTKVLELAPKDSWFYENALKYKKHAERLLER